MSSQYGALRKVDARERRLPAASERCDSAVLDRRCRLQANLKPALGQCPQSLITDHAKPIEHSGGVQVPAIERRLGR